MLISRWQSLRQLRILIKDETSAACANLWIQACIVLHNYLVDLCDASNVVMGVVEMTVPDQVSGEGEEEVELDITPSNDDGNSRRNYVYEKFRAR